MRFNIQRKKTSAANALNLAGGEAFTESTKLELASLMLTSTLQSQYYRAADVAAGRIKQLIAQVGDKQFVAKAAIYARMDTLKFLDSDKTALIREIEAVEL